MFDAKQYLNSLPDKITKDENIKNKILRKEVVIYEYLPERYRICVNAGIKLGYLKCTFFKSNYCYFVENKDYGIIYKFFRFLVRKPYKNMLKEILDDC